MILVLHVMTMSWPTLMNILQKMLFSCYNLFICKPHFSGFDLSKSLLKTQAKLEFKYIKVHLIHKHTHTKMKQNIKQSNLKWRKEHSLLNYYWINSPKILVKKMHNLKCVNPCTRIHVAHKLFQAACIKKINLQPISVIHIKQQEHQPQHQIVDNRLSIY